MSTPQPRMTVIEAMRHDAGIVLPEDMAVEVIPAGAFDAAAWHWRQLELHVHQHNAAQARVHLAELMRRVPESDSAQPLLRKLEAALGREPSRPSYEPWNAELLAGHSVPGEPPNWDAAAGLLEALRAAL
jgi:hypothetical protein